MNGLIGFGLVVTGLLVILQVAGIAAVLLSGHPHTSLFFIKHAVFTAGFAGAFRWLYHQKNRILQQRIDVIEAKRTHKKLQEGVWPPPPAA